MKNKNDTVIFCCDDFKNAFDVGTDNEAYSSALKDHGGIVSMGCAGNIKFCPFCGSTIRFRLNAPDDDTISLPFKLRVSKAFWGSLSERQRRDFIGIQIEKRSTPKL